MESSDMTGRCPATLAYESYDGLSVSENRAQCQRSRGHDGNHVTQVPGMDKPTVFSR
jgi:hypothetical protein